MGISRHESIFNPNSDLTNFLMRHFSHITDFDYVFCKHTDLNDARGSRLQISSLLDFRLLQPAVQTRVRSAELCTPLSVRLLLLLR